MINCFILHSVGRSETLRPVGKINNFNTIVRLLYAAFFIIFITDNI